MRSHHRLLKRFAIIGLLCLGILFGSANAALANSYSFITLDDPSGNPGTTVAYGINSSGQVVGFFSNGTGTHGFVYTAGVFTTLDVPGASNTVATGINDSGQIVGYYSDATGSYGFVDTGGVFATTIQDPIGHPGNTSAWGINNSGQVVGLTGGYTGGLIGFLETGGGLHND
jgi:probable HAF family extracellular repeat protein